MKNQQESRKNENDLGVQEWLEFIAFFEFF